MTIKIAFSILGTLAVLYVAWRFVGELRTGRDTRLGTFDSLLMAVWAVSAALLPWVGDDFLPWFPKVGLVITVLAVTVGLLALRQMVRAHKARTDA